MSMSPALIAIALEFAHDCHSHIEREHESGHKYMPAQLPLTGVPLVSDCGYGPYEPNFDHYTIVQLGMVADLQREADKDYYLAQEIREATRKAQHEILIRKTIAMGAGNRKTAERWIRQAA